MLFQECRKCNKILNNEPFYYLTENNETFIVCKQCHTTAEINENESILLEG